MKCRICSAVSVPIGEKLGTFRKQIFRFERCPECGYVFVANPWTEYDQIYNEAYYRGLGPDPLIDYIFELENPVRTVRIHEWRGILEVVNSFLSVNSKTKWIDFGCGNGGLVRHVRGATGCSVLGFEEGWVADLARRLGIPILRESELDAHERTCDIVTAIEVIEHVDDPVAVIRKMARLLKPGGILFVTTGNAERFRGRVLEWGYAVPEIHISYFEPRTLQVAFEKAGLRAEFHGSLPGFDSIVRYKILKSLKVRQITPWEALLPWRVLLRLAYRSHGPASHPIARRI